MSVKKSDFKFVQFLSCKALEWKSRKTLWTTLRNENTVDKTGSAHLLKKITRIRQIFMGNLNLTSVSPISGKA